MSKVSITKSKLDALATAVSAKSGVATPITIDEMTTAVANIQTGGNTFVITIVWNDQTEAWEPDKAFAEISAAYHDGKNIVLEMEYPGSAAVDGEYIDNGGSDDAYEYVMIQNRPDEYGRWSQNLSAYTYTEDGLELDYEMRFYEPNLVDETVTPTESQQTVTYDPYDGYTGLGTVTVNAISSDYVGSGVARKSSSDLTASGATVSVPSGYYSSSASKMIASGTEGTPIATKGAVSNHSVSITPSVTNSAGYITGGTKSGTAITVSASELVSGTKSISANGTGIDVTNFSAVNVSVPPVGYDIPTFTATIDGGGNIQITCDKTYAECRTLASDDINVAILDAGAITNLAVTAIGSGYITYNQVTLDDFDGISDLEITYHSNSTITFTQNIIPPRDSSDLTVSGATVNAPAGYYANNASKSVTSMTLPTELTNSASGTQKATLTVDNGSIYHYLQIPAGYNATNSFYNIQAKTGSATTPATTITANPSISVSSGGLITATTGASQSVTPTISAGYVSSGTAGTVTVSGSNTSQLSTQAATTITPTESEQTAVSAGKYTTGAVKVGAISSTYVGSGITQRDSSDMAFNPQIQSVVAPAGYYAAQSTYQVSSGTAGTPTATKGTVSNHSVSVTPSVTNTTGYIVGSTKTGTAVTVSASELVSGSQTVTSNQTVDVTNLAEIVVNVPTYTLLATQEFTVNTTSTTASSIGTIDLGSSAFTTDYILYVQVRDKAGRRGGYFNGSDSFLINYRPQASGYITTNSDFMKAIHRYSTGDVTTTYCAAGTTGYGIYPYSLSTDGVLTLYRRYNSTYSTTINGTYTVRVYRLDYAPTQGNPYTYS